MSACSAALEPRQIRHPVVSYSRGGSDMTTVAEALGQVDSINNLADLRALALELSAAADKPNAILYSGPLADTQAYRVAPEIAEQLDLAIIDNTPRGQFLLSDEVDAAS